MTLPEVYQLFDYWKESPPLHEIGAIMLRVYTNWSPGPALSPEEKQRKSLEDRWKAGAMNVKQMFEATGGTLSRQGEGAAPIPAGHLPGVGPWPFPVH